MLNTWAGLKFETSGVTVREASTFVFSRVEGRPAQSVPALSLTPSRFLNSVSTVQELDWRSAACVHSGALLRVSPLVGALKSKEQL